MSKRSLAIGGAVLAVALVWLMWPSKYSRVADLDSAGSNIIAFGDSLTAGYGASAGEDYPSRLSLLIGSTVINAGVSGDTTQDALARLDTDVLARDPRIVIVGLGGNDYLRSIPISATEANLRSIIRKIHDAHAMVVLLGFRFPESECELRGHVRSSGERRAMPGRAESSLGHPDRSVAEERRGASERSRLSTHRRTRRRSVAEIDQEGWWSTAAPYCTFFPASSRTRARSIRPGSMRTTTLDPM